MIVYDISPEVRATSTCIGDIVDASVITPQYQAHSTRIAVISDEIPDTYGVDALITDRRGIAIGVRTADCVPILLYDKRHHAIAAIHSGWKGTVSNIIEATIQRLKSVYGSIPSELSAVIGPCIHIEAFEVGDEVFHAFARAGYSAYARRMANPYTNDTIIKWHIDLPGICDYQLANCGVNDIYTSPLCTYRNHDRLYSYRYTPSNEQSHRIITSIRLNTEKN